MTSEIMIMNREAVALAADSAVTTGVDKVFTTADKIFPISHNHPIGFMIYGNSCFMGIPWETIIVRLRDEIGQSKYGLVNDYCKHLLLVIDRARYLTNTGEEEKYVKRKVNDFFTSFLSRIFFSVKEINQFMDEGMNSAEISVLVGQLVKLTFQDIDQADYYFDLPDETDQYILEKYSNLVSGARSAIFGSYDLSSETCDLLDEMGRQVIIKPIEIYPFSGRTGIVISGFGEGCFFPRTCEIKIDGMFNNTVLQVIHKDKQVNFSNTGFISAFAQDEMVDFYLNGIDKKLFLYTDNSIKKIITSLPEIILDRIDELDDKKRLHYKKIIRKSTYDMIQKHSLNVKQFSVQNFKQPVLEIVQSLPKKDLGIMAETFVHMNMVKKKMQRGRETVAGPIDVALISRTDGFVWIKKKQYYSYNLNPHLLQCPIQSFIGGVVSEP